MYGLARFAVLVRRNLQRELSRVVYDVPRRYQRHHHSRSLLLLLLPESCLALLTSYFRRRCNRRCKQLMCSEFAVFGKPRSTQLVYTQRGNTLRVSLQLGPFSISSSDVLF